MKFRCLLFFALLSSLSEYSSAQKLSVFAERSYLYAKVNMEDDLALFFSKYFGPFWTPYQNNEPDRGILSQSMRLGVKYWINPKMSIGVWHRHTHKGLRSHYQESHNQDQYPLAGGYANYYRLESHELALQYQYELVDKGWYSIAVSVDAGVDLYHRFQINLAGYRRPDAVLNSSGSHKTTLWINGNIIDEIRYGFRNQYVSYIGYGGVVINLNPVWRWLTWYVRIDGGYKTHYLHSPNRPQWRLIDSDAWMFSTSFGCSINL